MMKKLLLIGAISAGALAHAQNVPNGGFETWNDNGMYEDPDQWASLNMLSILGAPLVVTPSGDVHSGNYSAKIETVLADMDQEGVANDTLPGSMFLGSIDLVNQEATNGAAFAFRPDSLTGWYKYAPVNGDMWAVQVTLTKWNSASGTTDVLGTGEFIGTTAESAYTRFSMEIDYTMPGTPDSLQIMVMSSGGQPSPGTALWVDDFEFVTNSTAATPALQAAPMIRYYPNPANHSLTVITAKSATIGIYNALGMHIGTVKTKAGEKTAIHTDEYRNGVYFLRTETGELERFVVQH